MRPVLDEVSQAATLAATSCEPLWASENKLLPFMHKMYVWLWLWNLCDMYHSCHTLSFYVMYKYVADLVASISCCLASTITDSSSGQMHASIHQKQSMSRIISPINGNRITYNSNCCGCTTWQGSWHFATAAPFHMHWCRSCTQQHRTATAHPHATDLHECRRCKSVRNL